MTITLGRFGLTGSVRVSVCAVGRAPEFASAVSVLAASDAVAETKKSRRFMELLSECCFQGKLNEPWIVSLTADNPELGSAYRHTRIAKLRVVK